MNADNNNPDRDRLTTGSLQQTLPPKVSIAVQLIGTFGLAVFLVVNYVLFVQPKEQDQQKQLIKTISEIEESMQTLDQTVRENIVRLNPDQTNNLNKLYMLAVINTLEDELFKELNGEVALEDLERLIEATMVNHLDKLQGFRDKNGFTICNNMHKIIIDNPGLSKRLAKDAQDEWVGLTLDEISKRLEREMQTVIASY